MIDIDITTKRYIVLISEEFNAKVKDSITAYFQQKEMLIWHWISNAWLVVDPKGSSNSKTLREDLYRITNAGTLLIFEVDNPTKCTGISTQQQSQWILENWIDDTPRF